MTENWRPISDWSDYEVSDHGRVLSHKFGKIRILKQSDDSCGYPRVRLCANGKQKEHSVHKLVAEAFLGPRPEGHEVNHKDGVKHHNVPSNLEWTTHAENKAHAAQMGLVARGERQGSSKLTTAQVVEMRQLYEVGDIAQRKLAKLFGVSQRNVSKIVRFVSWRHVPA